MSESAAAELTRLSAEWDRAMLTNDADTIGRFMSDDWIIIGTDGSIESKSGFLELMRSGDVTHSVMESHDLDVRVYGDAAVVIARGVSGAAARPASGPVRLSRLWYHDCLNRRPRAAAP